MHRSDSRSSFGLLRLVGIAIALGIAAPAAAQEPVYEIPRGPSSRSPFNLGGIGDMGVVGFRTTGNATSLCVTNAAGLYSPRDFGCDEPVILNTTGGNVFAWFEMPFVIAAPPSDLPPGVDPSQLNGNGWTVNMTATLPSARQELLPTDRSGRDLLNLGITATEDGSCRDFSGLTSGRVYSGVQLLPHIDCRVTWPPSATEWPGRKKISQENFLAAQPIINPTGNGDPFAFWLVPEELTTGQPLGDQATFGEFSDFSADLLSRYPPVVPGGGGATPLIRGWPLGLTVEFDAFYFTLPGINNALFAQYIITNDSEKVWGQPVDYDSIYIGIVRSPGNDQFQTFNVDLSRGLWFANRCNVSGTPTAKPHPLYGNCPNVAKDGLGIQGFMVFKSPIGDLRNKLLSDPLSPFFNPSHPNADDTITFNHSHGCTFITCTNETFDRSERALFGLFSSTLENVLDGRSPGEMGTDGAYFNIVHPSEVWPTRGDFNKYVPGDWDYNNDGVPDTIYIDQCGSRGCVPPWSDTVPGGWINRSGQVAPMSIGPFKLRAGEKTGLIIAYVAERNRATFETLVEALYNLYMNFFLLPQPATPPRVHAEAVAVTGGASGGDADSAQVRLYLTDDTRNFVDEFLLNLADQIENASPESHNGKLRLLNPWLVDSLRARARNNVQAIYVFRSCDGGATFTDDADCFGDPVSPADETSKWSTFGWLPWRTLSPTARIVVDDDVVGGLTYFYSLVTETRGAQFTVLRDRGEGPLPMAGGQAVCDPTRCEAKDTVFAPSILSALARTADAPTAATVYVPLSKQSGVAAAEARVTSALGRALVPVTVRPTAGARAGQFRAVFSDTAMVTTAVTARVRPGGRLDTLEVAATVQTNTGLEFNADALVTLQGHVRVAEDTTTSDDRITIVTTHRVVAASPARTMTIVETTGGAARPILVTGTLGENTTTPGSFTDRPDFPGFILDVNASAGGTFGGQYYSVPGRDSLPVSLTNGFTVEWLTASARATRSPVSYSEYRIEWVDRPYGPGEPFAVGDNLAERVAASLSERASAGTSLADDATLTKVQAVVGDTAPAQLQAYELPFRIVNVTENRPVQVAVVTHRETISILVPPDTVRVSVPSNRWSPGDRLVLLEEIGGELQPTWVVTIGCATAVGLAEACNAVRGSDYRPTAEAGAVLHLRYYRPLTAGTEFTFEVLPRRAAPDLARSDLRRIQVVPNPYIFFSQFERAPGASVIKFTNVPPTGRIRIYTVAGQFVQEITWTEQDLNGNGDLEWNLVSRENTQIAYGLYIWVLDSPMGQARGKFVVLR